MLADAVAGVAPPLPVPQDELHDDVRIMNAMTVDVEDYFQVSAFEQHVSPQRWDHFESRVERNTCRLLEMFDSAGITATFFILGWVGDRFPSLVRRIAAAGHEIASHGYAHRLVYDLTPSQFRQDLRRAKAVLEDASGSLVLGYRAPSFSITRRSMWALDVLAEEGYAYDASVFPVRHDRYGIPDAPRHVHRISRMGRELWEFPGSTICLLGQNLAVAGGGYFRLLPYAWTRHGISSVNTREGKPVIFYIHPWEIDPAQPRLNGPWISRFRHYRNLEKTEQRLQRLLSDFRFGSALSVLTGAASDPVSMPESSLALA